MTEERTCPSCGHVGTYIVDHGRDRARAALIQWCVVSSTDYQRTADGEMRVDHCEACDWPPGTPMSPQEWRDSPDNPLNQDDEDRV